MKILVTPPFEAPTAPAMLELETELAPILGEHGIEVVTSPTAADLELCGAQGAATPASCRLPRHRVVVVAGRSPHPDRVAPHYVAEGYAAVLTPVNSKVYEPDCMAFFVPPAGSKPRTSHKRMRIAQLATYQDTPGNANDGTHMFVNVNGRAMYAHRVLGRLRSLLGLTIKQFRDDLIDIYGKGWPAGVEPVEDSRDWGNFLERRHAIAARYGFDLCWESMEIPRYVTEKFWSALRAGALPLYWGPTEFHELLPKDTIVDCRCYERAGGFDWHALVYDIINMSADEYARRLSTLLDWYHSLPADAARKSHIAAAHALARTLVAVAA